MVLPEAVLEDAPTAVFCVPVPVVTPFPTAVSFAPEPLAPCPTTVQEPPVAEEDAPTTTLLAVRVGSPMNRISRAAPRTIHSRLALTVRMNRWPPDMRG